MNKCNLSEARNVHGSSFECNISNVKNKNIVDIVLHQSSS